MKLGIEFNHGFRLEGEGLEDMLLRARAMGAQGGQFKNPTYISPTLDYGELHAAADTARDLGMYLVAGLGRINPYNTSEAPEFWALGGGSYKKGCERIIAACAEMGSHHLVSQTAGWRGWAQPYNTDRFREDVTWREQLEATKRFLRSLAPALRHYGSTIAVETHEEITSFEVLELIEDVGDDVVSAALDTANVTSRGEDPVAAARRLGPAIRQLHAKDCLFLRNEKGLVRNIRPAGDGVLDFSAIAAIVAENSPDALWNVEDHMGEMFIEYKDEAWRAAHPDLQMDEIAALERMADASAQKIASGAITAPDVYEKIPYEMMCIPRIERALHYLRPIVAR